jgi:hypothetical protein
MYAVFIDHADKYDIYRNGRTLTSRTIAPLSMYLRYRPFIQTYAIASNPHRYAIPH